MVGGRRRLSAEIRENLSGECSHYATQPIEYGQSRFLLARGLPGVPAGRYHGRGILVGNPPGSNMSSRRFCGPSISWARKAAPTQKNPKCRPDKLEEIQIRLKEIL